MENRAIKFRAWAKAKPVSRSVFQKKSEECKKLKNDIYQMVMKRDIETFKKWRKHFESEEQWNELLREAILKTSIRSSRSK